MKHPIQLCSGDWAKQMKNTNEAVGTKNHFYKYGGKKRLVHPFIRQEFWKNIGCILSEFSYEKNGHKIWEETSISLGKKA